MRHATKIVSVYLILALTLSLILVPLSVSADDAYNRFEDAGQQTHHVSSTSSAITLDGKIEEGEWPGEPIVLTLESPGLFWLDWSTGLPESELSEILPFGIKYYAAYSTEGLYVGAEITDANHYSPKGIVPDMWTGDCFVIDVAIDAFDAIADGTYTEVDMLDHTRLCVGLIDNGDGAPYPLGFVDTASSYGEYVVTLLPLEEEYFCVGREEMVTTYEIFMPWSELWCKEEVPTQVFMNYQLHCADQRYESYCEPGYDSCVGGLRYAVVLNDEQKEAYDTTNTTIYHIYLLDDTTNVNDETSAEETEVVTTPPLPALDQDNVINLWDEETMHLLFAGGNQTEISFSDEGLVLTWVTSEGADPYFIFPISNYYKKVDATAPTPDQANYVVFKIKATGCDGNFELFTNNPAAGDSATASYTGNGEWEYIIVDMSLTTLVEAKKLTTMRIDWSAGNTQEGATMTIGEIGFFAEYDDALAFTGVDITVTDPPVTKAPVTEAPTDPVTEAPTAEETEAPTSGGCSSVVSVGTGMILMAAAAAFVLKRRSI